jgi:hypothetical protein
VLERCPDAAVQSPQLCAVEAGRGPQRAEPRPPQRFVRVDVPDSCHRALVEQRGLQRGSTACEALTEAGRGEERVERLVADARSEIRLRLAGLEQKPGSEAADVSIRDVRSVV